LNTRYPRHEDEVKASFVVLLSGKISSYDGAVGGNYAVLHGISLTCSLAAHAHAGVTITFTFSIDHRGKVRRYTTAQPYRPIINVQYATPVLAQQ